MWLANLNTGARPLWCTQGDEAQGPQGPGVVHPAALATAAAAARARLQHAHIAAPQVGGEKTD